MLDSYFDVKINGIKYKLAAGAEGEHYVHNGDPLRNQNYAVVESGDNQQFQMNPALKIWAWTDWSGGEGQFKYSPDNPAGYWEGNNINPVLVRGTIRPGPGTQITAKSAGGDFDKNVLLVRAHNKLYGVNQEDRIVYEWVDASSWWDAGTTNASGTAATGAAAVCGDATYLYYKETSTDQIFRWDGTTFTLWNDDTGVTDQNVAMVSLGKYIYLYEPETCKLWEIPKTGAAPVASVLLHNFSDEGGEIVDHGKCQMVTGHNRVYFTQVTEQDTVVFEVVPTTAAGTGFAKEISRLDGFYCEAITFMLGFLYLVGKDTTDPAGTSSTRMIVYMEPGGDYGTLGLWRTDDPHASLPVTGDANSMLTAMFAARTGAYNAPRLFGIDAVTGAVYCLSSFEYGDSDTVVAESMVQHRGEVFWATDPDATGNGVYRTMRGTGYVGDASGEDMSYVISPVWDFGLSEDKLLQSIRLLCEPLPADWTVHVDYQDNQDGTWTNIIGYTSDSGTGITAEISSSASSVSFKNLQLRIRFQYTGGATPPSTAPVVHSIEVLAAVLAPLESWDLLLELSDEDGQAQDRSYSGTTLLTNLATAFATQTVVEFLDGYISRSPNVYNGHSVYIERWRTILDRPGEGFAAVRLTKVV